MKISMGLVAAFSLFAATGTVINFDTAPLGQTPPGWSASPRWEVLKDQSAPTQPYVLAQEIERCLEPRESPGDSEWPDI